jgi:hypothetical protein
VSVVNSYVESLHVDLACLPNCDDDVGQATIYFTMMQMDRAARAYNCKIDGDEWFSI